MAELPQPRITEMEDHEDATQASDAGAPEQPTPATPATESAFATFSPEEDDIEARIAVQEQLNARLERERHLHELEARNRSLSSSTFGGNGSATGAPAAPPFVGAPAASPPRVPPFVPRIAPLLVGAQSIHASPQFGIARSIRP